MCLQSALLIGAALVCRAQDDEFAPLASIATGFPSVAAIDSADLDGDGDQDLLVATGASGSIVWFENDGNTNPSYPTSHVISNAILNAAHVSAADVDGDGDQDVLGAVSAASAVAIWYENTGGLPPVFVPRVIGPISPNDIGGRINAARAGDLDGDGDTDLVLAYHANPLATQGHVIWYRNNGNPVPGFTAIPLTAPSGAIENISDIQLADLDGNQALDIVAVSETPNTSGGRNRVVWWSSSGGASPTFQYHSVDNALIDPVSLAVGQFSGNPARDLAVAASGSGQVVIFQSTGGSTPTFSPAGGVALLDPRSLRSQDIDNDGDADIAVALRAGAEIVLLENQSQPTPSFLVRGLGATSGACVDITIGDLNRDGRPDIAGVFPDIGNLDRFEQVLPIANLASGSLHATFAQAVTSASNGQTLRVPSERLLRDPTIDLMGKSLNLLSDEAFALGQDSVVRFADGSNVVAAPGKPLLLDGVLDIPAASTIGVFADQNASLATSLLLTSGSELNVGSALDFSGMQHFLRTVIDGDETLGTFQNLVGRPVDVQPFALPSGETGIAVAGDSPGGPNAAHPASLAVYAPDPQSASGWTGYPVDNTALATHGPIAVGDLNGDGLDDLATIREVSGSPRLRIHIAQQGPIPSFVSSSAATGIPSQHLHAVDLDFDGNVDLVTGQGWFRSSGGSSPTFAYIPFPVVSALESFGLVVCDFDLDGGRDIAVHCEKRTMGIPGRVGYQLYVLHSDGNQPPSFTPILVQELDHVQNGSCTGDVDCYPMTNIELAGLNTLSREDQNMDSLTDLFMSEDDGITLFTNQSSQQVPAFSSTIINSDSAFDELLPLDFDGDHDVDLVASSMRTSRVRFLEFDGVGYGESRTIKPILRASGTTLLGTDVNGLTSLAVIGTAFDRVQIVSSLGFPQLSVLSSVLDCADTFDVGRGSLVLANGQVTAGGDLIIGPRGLLAGEGGVQGSVYNSGVVRPRKDLVISGDYAHYTFMYPDRPGQLQIELREESPLDLDRLVVGSAASLGGSLIVRARDTFVPNAGAAVGVLLASDIDDGRGVFDVAQMPRMTVLDSGDPTIGTLMPSYNDNPPSASVSLVPTPMTDPNPGDRTFTALGAPADAVVLDFTGGPNGEPDGFADTAIAYPVIPGGPEMGGVAVFTGTPTPNFEFDFQTLAIYTGKLAAKPVAIEAGDYDGDERIEIAVGNSLTDTNQTLVFLLEVDSSLQIPVFESSVPPLLTRRGAKVLDLTTADIMPGSNRSPTVSRIANPIGLVVLSDIEDSGVATAAVYAAPDWETCDVDVCDDPDSVDPIDVDGAGGTLIAGYCATSNGDNKVVVAANPASSPGMFETIMVDVGDGPTELRAEDLDSDGFPDISVVNETSGTLSVILNISDAGGPGGRGFKAHLELDLRVDPSDPDPLPSSVALADLDDDGDLDIAVVSTNELGERAVRRLDNQYVETGVLTFTGPVDLAEQPAGVPLFVREANLDADGGGIALNDDLVVYVDPSGSGRPTVSFGPGMGHVTLLAEPEPPCLADVNHDGMVTPADFSAWLAAYNASAPECDQNSDGLCAPDDFSAWIANYNAGCP